VHARGAKRSVSPRGGKGRNAALWSSRRGGRGQTKVPAGSMGMSGSQDAVMQQIFGLANQLLREAPGSAERRLNMRTYKVRGQGGGSIRVTIHGPFSK